MATKTTTQNGAWDAGATWGGTAPVATDDVIINHAVTTPAGNTTIAGVLVNASGTLTFPAATSSKLIFNNKNFELRGLLTMRPNSISVVHEIQFINIVESNFVGGGNIVLPTDIGLWGMGAGRLDIEGAVRKRWTRTTGSVALGAVSMTVEDSTGWQIGDEIYIVPTSEIDTSGMDYDDGNLVSIDPFMNRFEPRIITSKTGNVIGWSNPLTYAHNSVTSNIPAGDYPASSRTWYAEVGNLTSNVIIRGETTKKRAHVLMRNTAPAQHVIKNIKFQYLGPRKVDTNVNSYRPALISGRYGLHFHHCDYNTQNTVIDSCVMTQIGNRGYVMHNSHKITATNNICHDYEESAFWWDEGHISHFITWEDNLMTGMRWNGLVGSGFFSMGLLKGDNNVARRNVVVYGSNGNQHGNGAYQWSANSEGVWIFENNLAHSCLTGLWVWQNTSQNHTIVDFDGYHNTEGVSHGAYGNSYQYTRGHHFKSPLHIVAVSANTNGVVFKDYYVDNGNTIAYCAILEEKNAAGTPERTNKFVQCVFKNYTSHGVLFLAGGTGGFALPKMIDLINCDIGANNGTEYQLDGTNGWNPGSWVRLQKPGSGTNRQHVANSSGVMVLTSGIADFAPNFYGTGILGLKADYFNGALFTDYKVSQFHAILYFDVWRPDSSINSDGIHHLISSSKQDPPGSGNLVSDDYIYSVRWTGRVQPHYTGGHVFTIGASGQFRMYIELTPGVETLVINGWNTTSPDPNPLSSASLSLTQGTYYAVRLEFNNLSSGAQGFQFYWKTAEMATNQLVPQSQLYEPVTNTAPVANAGNDQTITLPTAQVSLSGIGSSDIDGTITTWSWTRISGPNTPTIQNPSSRDTTVGAAGTALIAGTYVFRLTVTDDDGATHTDDVTVTVNAANSLPVVNAGADQIVTMPANPVFLSGTASDPDAGGSIVNVLWTKDSGPAGHIFSAANALDTQVTGIVAGTYVFRLTATDNLGGTSFDQVQINVNPAVANIPPVANAGPDKSVNTPATSTLLQGSGTDADGTVVFQQWTQVSGPNSALINTPAAMDTIVQNLIVGTYVFRLRVRDNQQAEHTDDVTVTVTTPAGRGYLIVRPKRSV